MNLPCLPFRQVVDELVDSLGLHKVLTLRLVNVRLDHEILDVILARQLIAERKGVPFPYIRKPIMTKLLLKRVENPRIDENPLILAIRRTAESINGTYRQHIDLPKDGVKYILCTAAVNHLGSRRTAQLMASSCQGQIQATHDPNDLVTAAALLGSLEALEILLSKGAEVSSVSKYFGTPLQAAAAQGHHETALCLLEQGADIDYVALRSASRRDHKPVVRLLLDPVYNLKSSGADYENAIMDAAHAGHTDMVKCLFERGSFTNISNLQYEVLWTACRFGYLRIVQIMLDQGLDVNATKIGGSRALESAAYYGHVPVVSLLFEKGADLQYEGNEWHAVHAAASNGHEEVVQMLLDNGADINSSGSRSLTPLWEAAKNQQLSMMRFLLNNGADLAVDECGDYAFFRAVIQGHEQVVRILAEAGVNVDGVPSDSEPPPILNAMIHGQKSMVKVLLELGAQWVDPLKSAWGEKFLDGTYPIRPSPPTFLKN